MQARFARYLAEDKRSSPEMVAESIADILEQPNPPFRSPVGPDAEYLLSLHRRLSDAEWDEQMPAGKGLDW